jgi:hypothetical protein
MFKEILEPFLDILRKNNIEPLFVIYPLTIIIFFYVNKKHVKNWNKLKADLKSYIIMGWIVIVLCGFGIVLYMMNK